MYQELSDLDTVYRTEDGWGHVEHEKVKLRTDGIAGHIKANKTRALVLNYMIENPRRVKC